MNLVFDISLTSVVSVNLTFSLKEDLFQPTIYNASKIIGMTSSEIRALLSSNSIYINKNGYLSEQAINCLSNKYIEKIKDYYENCSKSLFLLPSFEKALFISFIKTYSNDSDNISSWDDINTDKIISDFKDELFDASHYSTKDIIDNDFRSSSIWETTYLYPIFVKKQLLHKISQSQYYNLKHKKIPTNNPNFKHIIYHSLFLFHKLQLNYSNSDEDNDNTLTDFPVNINNLLCSITSFAKAT